MAGTIKVDNINADSNLALKIANTAVAFIDSTGLRPVSGNLNLDATSTSKLYLPSANTVAIQTAGVTAVTVNSSQNVTLAAALAVTGALSKGSGSFRIEHPLTQLALTHELVHSFIEGPQADLIYRGKVNLLNGVATVNIDAASSMTEGTFVALCRDVQCFTTNESDWTAVRGSVTENLLKIEAEDNTSTASISWMVIGERQDKHMMETEWTDSNGKVIVEPLKSNSPPKASTFIVALENR
jgi:hypothetical protein